MKQVKKNAIEFVCSESNPHMKYNGINMNKYIIYNGITEFKLHWPVAKTHMDKDIQT